jgi:hypothetical protein
MQESRERVLLVESDPTVARRVVQRILAAGGEPTVVASTAAARSTPGTFDRGIFAFNLPDGTGIVLAAELMLEDRIGAVAFLHPDERLIAQTERPSRMQPAPTAVGVQEGARQVA